VLREGRRGWQLYKKRCLNDELVPFSFTLLRVLVTETLIEQL
jgi:hypothetical protein